MGGNLGDQGVEGQCTGIQVTHADTDDRCHARRLYPTPAMPSLSSPGPGSPPHGSRATSSWKPSRMLSKELTFLGTQSPPPWTGRSIFADAMLLHPDALQPLIRPLPTSLGTASGRSAEVGCPWAAGACFAYSKEVPGILVWSSGTALNY